MKYDNISIIIELTGLILYSQKLLQLDEELLSSLFLTEEGIWPYVKKHTLDHMDNIVLVLAGRYFTYCFKYTACAWLYYHFYFGRKLF